MKQAIPRHVGVIPDGNRRWAAARGLPKPSGYGAGIDPGLRLAAQCRRAGIAELSVYGFTKENTRRAREQVSAFRDACSAMAALLEAAGADVRVVGDRTSAVFPRELRRFPDAGERTKRRGSLRVNLLVNYGWRWDLEGWRHGAHRTRGVPPVDLVVRWGGGRRLSGFLPVQSAYADVYVVDELWPDYRPEQFAGALAWYRRQDRTLGG